MTDAQTSRARDRFETTIEREDEALEIKALPAGHLLLAIDGEAGRREIALEPQEQAALMMGLHVAWVNRSGGDGHPFENEQVQAQVEGG